MIQHTRIVRCRLAINWVAFTQAKLTQMREINYGIFLFNTTDRVLMTL